MMNSGLDRKRFIWFTYWGARAAVQAEQGHRGRNGSRDQGGILHIGWLSMTPHIFYSYDAADLSRREFETSLLERFPVT